MNIADLIASKLAAAQQPPPPAPAPAPPPPEPELAAAIDRIDPPGKSQRSAAARATRALILNADQKPPAAPAPASLQPSAEVRSLGSHRGEMIDLTPPGSPPRDADWNRAALMPETSLCLVRDKHSPEHAWIAVQMDGNRTPILLMSLPLFDAAEPF